MRIRQASVVARRLAARAAAIGFALSLVACGQKGPLALPAHAVPVAAPSPAAVAADPLPPAALPASAVR